MLNGRGTRKCTKQQQSFALNKNEQQKQSKKVHKQRMGKNDQTIKTRCSDASEEALDEENCTLIMAFGNSKIE